MSYSSKPDCKGSNFRGLRNLEPDVVSLLLQEVVDDILSLQKLNSKCQEIKKVYELKRRFLQCVGN